MVFDLHLICFVFANANHLIIIIIVNDILVDNCFFVFVFVVLVLTFRLNVDGANGFAELVDSSTGVLAFVSGSDTRDEQRHVAGGRLVRHLILAALWCFAGPRQEPMNKTIRRLKSTITIATDVCMRDAINRSR